MKKNLFLSILGCLDNHSLLFLERSSSWICLLSRIEPAINQLSKWTGLSQRAPRIPMIPEMKETTPRDKNMQRFCKGIKRMRDNSCVFPGFRFIEDWEFLRWNYSLRIIEGEKKRCQNQFTLDSRKDKKKIDLLLREKAELEKNINLAQSQVKPSASFTKSERTCFQQNRHRDQVNETEIRTTQHDVDMLDVELEEERKIAVK